MNYDIKIIGTNQDNGLIEFDRLNTLTKSTKDIATKALMLKLRGFSDIKPNVNLKKALSIYLENISGNKEEGTLLTIENNIFKETIKALQLDFFKPTEEILAMTPMSLVIKSFHAALSNDNEEADLDKPILKSLLSFQSNFINNNEIFYLSNRGTIPEIKLTKDDFRKIRLLEDKIPEPQKIIISGKLDEMKVSKGKLGLQTNDGLVNIFTNENFIIDEIVNYLGKDITISGIAHYKANGQLSFINIQNFREPSKNDIYFEGFKSVYTSEQQLSLELKKHPRKNSLNALKKLSGILKNDISDEDFNEMIKDIHQ
ncbi:hypothetical protein ACWKWW_12925 [Chryseobacterium cucumeris]